MFYPAFQKKTLLLLAATFALTVAFQNCAKSNLVVGENPITAEGPPGADHDPLKASSEESAVAAMGIRQGRLYKLLRLERTSQKTLSPTAGYFTLQFSSLLGGDVSSFPDEPFLKDISFIAGIGCQTQLEGDGRMSRLKDLPLRVGALELKVNTTSDLELSTPCVSAGSDDTAILELGYDKLIEAARAYVIVQDQLLMSLADGGIAVFQTAEQRPTDDLAALLLKIDGDWQFQRYEGNLCMESDPSSNTLCTMVLQTIDFQKNVNRLHFDAEAVALSGESLCHGFRGQLVPDLNEQHPGETGLRLSDLMLAVKDSPPGEVRNCQEAEALIKILANVRTASLMGGRLYLRTLGGVLKLSRPGETPIANSDLIGSWKLKRTGAVDANIVLNISANDELTSSSNCVMMSARLEKNGDDRIKVKNMVLQKTGLSGVSAPCAREATAETMKVLRALSAAQRLELFDDKAKFIGEVETIKAVRLNGE